MDEVEPILTKQRTRKPTLGPILINLDIMKQGTKVLGCNRAKRCPRSQDNLVTTRQKNGSEHLAGGHRTMDGVLIWF